MARTNELRSERKPFLIAVIWPHCVSSIFPGWAAPLSLPLTASFNIRKDKAIANFNLIPVEKGAGGRHCGWTICQTANDNEDEQAHHLRIL